MGGLVVIPNYPAPRYEFEIMNKTADGSGNSTLFLHFEVSAAYSTGKPFVLQYSVNCGFVDNASTGRYRIVHMS